MKTTIKTTTLLILLLIIWRPGFSQIQHTYYVEVDEVRHKTYNIADCVFNPYWPIIWLISDGGGSDNAEIESESKLTAKAWVYDDENSTKQGGTCMKKTGSFNSFNSYGSGTFLGSRTNNSTMVYLRLKAWEDDAGDRCDYDFGDDCYIDETAGNYPIEFFEAVPPSDTFNLTHQGGDIFGDSDKKLYVNVRWHYSGNDEPLGIGCKSRTITHAAGQIAVQSIYLYAGTKYVFETISGPDNLLTIYASDGCTVFKQNNNGGTGNWAKLSFTATTTGWYYLENSETGRAPLSASSKIKYKVDDSYNGYYEEFGDGYWQVYTYDNQSNPNTRSHNQTGEFIDNAAGSNLSFDTRNVYPDGSSPSDAPNYVGCEVGLDLYSVAYKRTNIPCGYYSLVSTTDNFNCKIFMTAGSTTPILSGTFNAGDTIIKRQITSSHEVTILASVTQGSKGFGVNWSTYVPDVGTLPPAFEIIDNSQTCGSTNITGRLISGNSGVRGNEGDYAWFLGSCGGPRLATSGGNYTSTSFTTNISETTVFYYGLVDQCENLQTACIAETAYVAQFTQADAGADFLDCNGNPTLDANTPETGIGTWSVISGSGTFANPNSPTSSVSALTPGENIFRWTLVNGTNCADSYDEITIQSGPPGDPNEFGDQVWNVYAYDTNDWNIPDSSYQGYYIHSTPGLSYDTRDMWDANLSPSSASTWYGCQVPNDNFAYAYKRTNFDCGYYEIVVEGHVGDLRIRVNGQTAMTHLGSGGPYAPSWTGFLKSNSTVEIIQIAPTGSSFHEISINLVTPPALQTGNFSAATGLDSLCAGQDAALYASGTTPANNEDFYWYKDGCGETYLGKGQFKTFSQTTTTTYYLRVENVCRSVVGDCDSVTVVNMVTPDAEAGPNQYISDTCATTMQATPIAFGTGTWYSLSGSGVIVDPNNPNTVITDLEPGNNWFRWEVTYGSCIPLNDQVNLFVGNNSPCSSEGGGFWNKTTPQPEVAVQEATLEAFPNPFHQSTTLRFSTPTGGLASLEIYNTNGQQVAALFQGEAEAGQPYELNFDPGDHSAGIYFAILRTADGAILNRKLIQLK
ncbi:MAG: T9SS type A sorting domain-containing protein [Bacteroidia bacterium]|nr:T9SS type A sorting domain-containing protein [Bacteroidia bacterium]